MELARHVHLPRCCVCVCAGTHGGFKALFDGPVQQREVVCMNLYKRVFPKWPEDPELTFA